MRAEMPKEMNSPRAVLSFSSLSVVQWLKSRLRSALRRHAGRTADSRRLANSSEKQKYPHPNHIAVFLVASVLIGGAGNAFGQYANRSVQDDRQFDDPHCSFATEWHCRRFAARMLSDIQNTSFDALQEFTEVPRLSLTISFLE